MTTLLAIGLPSIGFPELIVLGLLGLLFFGRRLPEVGRSLGKSIVQFKKGLADVEDDIDTNKPGRTLPPPDAHPAAETKTKDSPT